MPAEERVYRFVDAVNRRDLMIAGTRIQGNPGRGTVTRSVTQPYLLAETPLLRR
jgi:hypothetical protein